MRWHSYLTALVAILSLSLCPLVHAIDPLIQPSKKLLDGPLEDIQWADLQNVFIITERGTVYKSKDSGKTWSNIADNFRAGECDQNQIKIEQMHISPVDPNHIVFLGLHKCNFITTDMGKSMTYTPLDIKDVRLHPTQSSWILASSMSEGCDEHGQPTSRRNHCYKTLHYTHDFGTTWQPALKYVVQFDWSPPIGQPKTDQQRISDNLIYVTAHSVQTGNQRFGFWDKNIHFMSSTDYFQTPGTIVVPNGNRFLFGEHSLLFVAAVSPLDSTQVTLKVSRDNVTRLDFKSAQLPVELTEHSYTILDTSEGSVFLHVNHKPFAETAYAGHVYVSDWSGTKYSLSLPYNHRSADGKCDFEKVEGLEGIYLANFIDEDMIDEEEAAELGSSSSYHGRNAANQGKDRSQRLKTKTLITYDKGGEWHYLKPPTVDSKGNKITCPGDCQLHLHGITDLYGPFYSAASAIGLIMATGSIGTHLQANTDGINTYLSRDAGLTWFEVAKGSHIYEFGDHGGLIVMAEDSVKTNKIYYSWNEGLTWTELIVSDHLMQIENIIIEPEAVSQQFLIYGWEGETSDVGVIIYLPFDELHETACQGHDKPDTEESDYEIWSPSDVRLNGKCLLGHTVQYVRRKRDRPCYNPEAFERPIMKENCACTDEDFQCDYGYERPNKLGATECIEIPEIQQELAKQDQCATSSTYRISKGYRRVPGDTCTGGEKWDATELPCPSWGGSHIGKYILILLVLVVIAYALISAANKFEFLDDFLNTLKGRFSSVKYKLLGTESKPESMVDEDSFYLSEDEFGPSANLIDSDSAARRPSKKGDHDGLAHRTGTVNTSSIRPLPARSAAADNKVTKRVPALASPPASSDDFNPRSS